MHTYPHTPDIIASGDKKILFYIYQKVSLLTDTVLLFLNKFHDFLGNWF